MSLPPLQANNNISQQQQEQQNDFSQAPIFHADEYYYHSEPPTTTTTTTNTFNQRRRRRKSFTFHKKFAFLSSPSTPDWLGRDVFKSFLTNMNSTSHSSMSGGNSDNNNNSSSCFQLETNHHATPHHPNISNGHHENHNIVTRPNSSENLNHTQSASGPSRAIRKSSPSTNKLISTPLKILPKSRPSKSFNFIDEALGDRFVFYQIMAFLPMSACLGSALDLATLFEFENANHYTHSNGMSSLSQPLTRRDIYQRFENGSSLLNCMLVHSRWYQLLNDEVFYKIIVTEQFPKYFEMYYKYPGGRTLQEVEVYHCSSFFESNSVTCHQNSNSSSTDKIQKKTFPQQENSFFEPQWKMILIDILTGMCWSPFISREKEYCYFHPNTFFAKESRWKSSPSSLNHHHFYHAPNSPNPHLNMTTTTTTTSMDSSRCFSPPFMHPNSSSFLMISSSGGPSSTNSSFHLNMSAVSSSSADLTVTTSNTFYTFPKRGGVVCENGKVIKAPIEHIPRLKCTYQLFRMNKPILCDMNVEFQIVEERNRDFKSRIHEDNFILLGIVDSDLLYSHGDVVGTPTQTALVNEPMSETISAKFNYLGVYNIRSRYCGRSREVELNLGYASNGYLCYSTSNAGLFYDKWKPGDLISFEVTGINHFSRKRKRDRKKEYAQVLIRHNGRHVTVIEDFMLLNGPISRQDSITPFPKLYYFACNFYYGGNMLNSMAYPSGVKIHSIKYL
nr:unnamed protein product [Naegleria fowleri]